MLKNDFGGFVVSPETAVKGMFKDIGKEKMTRGCIQHDLLQSFLPLLPEGPVNILMLKVLVKDHKKQIEDGVAKKKTN